jgi:hypothetical protein
MTLLWEKIIFIFFPVNAKLRLITLSALYSIWFTFSYFLITGRSSRPLLPHCLENVANSTPTFFVFFIIDQSIRRHQQQAQLLSLGYQ